MNNFKADFNKIAEESENNPDVLGLILVGSRGKGFETEYSDYDAVMIVKDEVAEAFKTQYKNQKLMDIDLAVYSQSFFKSYAGWNSPEAWDRYNYTHTKVLVDKTQELSQLIKDKGSIPNEKLDEFVDQCIDGYINGVYRSVKCIRNNNKLGAHLEAVNSLLDLLTLVFALNCRHRPFLDYVEKELSEYPLEELPWSVAEFLKKVTKLLETGDLNTQQELLRGIETWCRKEGHGHIFDEWEGKDKWAMEYKHE